MNKGLTAEYICGKGGTPYPYTPRPTGIYVPPGGRDPKKRARAVFTTAEKFRDF